MLSVRLGNAVLGLLVAAVGLSGCVDPSASVGAARPADAAAFDGETGAVEGFVFDDEAQPVGGVEVALLELKVETRTDETGRFAFNNVAPGRYTLAYQRLGYETPATRRIDVVTGQATTLQLGLTPIAIHEGFAEVWTDKGFFDCSWRHVLGTGPCFFPAYTMDWPNSKRAWNYPSGPGVESAYNEITWNKGTFASGDSLTIFFSYANRTTAHTFCSGTSTSPATMHWERAGGCKTGGKNMPNNEPQTIPLEGFDLRTFINTGPASGPAGAAFGIAVQQSFEIWVSLFHWMAAPQDYSALPDQ